MFLILSLQLFALIRELLTDKFQVIHKVCLFVFFPFVKFIFLILIFSFMVLRDV